MKSLRPTVKASISATMLSAVLASCGGGEDTPAAPSLASLSSADACAALKGLSIEANAIALPTNGATITGTRLVAPSGAGSTAVGEHCSVQGAIAPVDRAAPDIQFDIALPTTWNRKAVHMFYGGFDGLLVSGSGNVLNADGHASPVARGYVGFGSDSGHSGTPYEASFALNEEALNNYMSDHMRKTRDVAVKVMDLRYGAVPIRMYSAGGSGGGRGALYVADRWPELYDGVIAYYPAWSLTAMLTNYNAIGKRLAAPGYTANAAKRLLLSESVVAACDAADGASDGVVSNIAACGFQPQTLRCDGGADLGDACLSDAQVSGFEALAVPLTFPYSLANGTTGYPGFDIFRTGMSGGNPGIVGDDFVRFIVYGDPSFDPLKYDPNLNGFVRHRTQYLSSRMDVNPNMSAFAAKGGKVIVVHGSSDDAIPHLSSREFYERAKAAMGEAQLRSSFRYYEVPGFAHGGGGQFNVSFDALDAIDGWADQGKAPEAPTARDTLPGANGRTRPLCEFPKWPRYSGTGNVNVASSFTCVE